MNNDVRTHTNTQQSIQYLLSNPSVLFHLCKGDRISMDRQLENHKTTVSRIVKMLGNRESAMDYLSKCIYAVAIGSNDYFNNYFIPVVYPTHFRFTPSQYATVLRRQFSQQLKVISICTYIYIYTFYNLYILYNICYYLVSTPLT